MPWSTLLPKLTRTTQTSSRDLSCPRASSPPRVLQRGPVQRHQRKTTAPAIIIGGYDADQAAEDTLRLAKQTLAELQVDLDLAPMFVPFVPGLRREFAILPIEARAGEDQQQFRVRVRDALRAVRAAKIVTGTRVIATSLPL